MSANVLIFNLKGSLMKTFGAPKRVVSLVPSITESLFDMGLGESVVGVTDYCIFPTDKVRGIKKVGGPKSVNINSVCELYPDLIFANQEENEKQEIETLISRNMQVVVFFPKTVSEAISDLYEIGRLFHNSNSIRVVQLLERSLDWLRLSIDSIETFRYFCPVWQGKGKDGLEWWMTFNKEVYVNDLLHLFGGRNCFAERRRKYPIEADMGLVQPVPLAGRDDRYPRVTKEEILLSNPDMIILPTEPYPFTHRHIVTFQKMFSGSGLAKNIKVLLVDGTLITWHGTRISLSMEHLPTLLQG